jgi:hypothetical protein
MGIPVIKCPQRNYAAGIPVVKKYLTETDPETGRPRLQILRGKAPNLVREFKEYIWLDMPLRRHRVKNPPDKPRKYKDHALDSLRFLASFIPSTDANT